MFYRVLRNAVIDHHRRGATRSKALERLAAELETARAGTEAHGAVCQCVKTLADTLEPEHAEALRRIELDGVAVKDYAQEIGITRNNAACSARGTRCANGSSAPRPHVRGE